MKSMDLVVEYTSVVITSHKSCTIIVQNSLDNSNLAKHNPFSNNVSRPSRILTKWVKLIFGLVKDEIRLIVQ